MQIAKAALLILFLALPWTLRGQAIANTESITRFETGGNFDWIHANAPPGQCGCFSLIGGDATFQMNITPRWAGMADVTYAHNGNVNVNGFAQSISIINYVFGPRYVWRRPSRYVPYGQVLFGGAKENVNFDFTINRQSFAIQTGGGVMTKIKPKIGINIVEVNYVYSRIPNAVNNTQNNLRISTGVTYHFGSH